MKIRVGSRESRLAVAQARLVMESIGQNHPEIGLELVTMKTTGDKILDKSLDKIGGKGLFVKELDSALLEGRVDLCVHSYKDLPAEDNPALPVVATSRREDPRDALLLPAGRRGGDVEGPIGCSSLRRGLQLAILPEAFATAPVRGNVITRLEKLDRGDFGALVLAAAGLKRLGLEGRVDRYFTTEEILPASCQGILAAQGRAGEDYSYLENWHNADALSASSAERAFVRALGAGCSSPVGAFAEVSGDTLRLRGLYVNDDGQIFRGQLEGPTEQAEALGKKLARALKAEGEH